MSSTDGLVFYKDRLLIPASLQREAINHLHCGHQGSTSRVLRAQDCIWWPRINEELENTSASCLKCQTIKPSQRKEPPIRPPEPEWPGDMICADIVSIQGSHYSVIVDRFSSWIDVVKVTRGAETIYQQLNRWYTNFGIPRSFASDGGPECTSTRMKTLHSRMGTI